MAEYPGTFWLLPMLALVLLSYLGIACWVYRDAVRYESERPLAWGIGLLLLGPANLVGLACYLLVRRNLEGTPEPPTRSDRLVRNVVVASLLTFVVVAFGPPDPFTQTYVAAVALPALVGLAVIFTYRGVLRDVR